MQEAKLASAVNHPNIAQIFEIGEADGVVFIAMEYVEGEPLSRRIQKGSVPAPDVMESCRARQVRRDEVRMTITDRIEVNPRVMLGKPVIRGTRIPVELLLRKLSEGATEADLLDAYPHLTREDIHAAMRYAADTLAHEEVVFIENDPAHSRE